MDQKQPLEVIGNDLVSIQMIPGQKEQKLSKKAKNSQLAITLSSSSEMNSFFVTNDNFCMQKQWPVQKNKLNFFAQKKLDFLVPLLLNNIEHTIFSITIYCAEEMDFLPGQQILWDSSTGQLFWIFCR